MKSIALSVTAKMNSVTLSLTANFRHHSSLQSLPTFKNTLFSPWGFMLIHGGKIEGASMEYS